MRAVLVVAVLAAAAAGTAARRGRHAGGAGAGAGAVSRTLIRHARSRGHLPPPPPPPRDAERATILESFDKSGEEPIQASMRARADHREDDPWRANHRENDLWRADHREDGSRRADHREDDPRSDDNRRRPGDEVADMFHKYFGNFSQTNHEHQADRVLLSEHLLNIEHSYNETRHKLPPEVIDSVSESVMDDSAENATSRTSVHEDVVTKFLRLIETQHLLGENCTAGTDLNLGEGVVDRYAQERFRVEADVAVNRANMLTRLWKYAGPSVMHNEYLLHASVFSMVEFDDDIFAAGNCYDQYQYKDYQLFCPFAYRLPEGPILAKDLAVEYKYLSNTSEWFYIARKNAERVIRNHNQFRRGYNTYTWNATTHSRREADEILSVAYEDGKWSKPYYDCGGGNIWMLTYTVPFFGYNNDTGTYFFKGTSGIDIDLRRVDIDQCAPRAAAAQLNIFAGTDKCKNRTTQCVPVGGLGFRRGSYRCECRRGFYFPNTSAPHRYYSGVDIELEFEKHLQEQSSRYSRRGEFECAACAEGCDACADSSPCVAALNWLLRGVILGLACLVICCLPAVVWFTVKYGHVRVVRAASPALLRVIVAGALLLQSTTLVMYARPTRLACLARLWLREIGFCLTYGALMLKTWRISVIFRVRSAKAVRISDMYLLRRVGVIVGGACALLALRSLVAPPAVIVRRTKDNLKAYLCDTDWWDHSFTTLEVVFLVWGIRLCVSVRKAPSEFNESRFISMAIYNEFLLSVFLNISMLFLQSPANPDLLYLIFFCHTQLTITLLLLFIFGSKAIMVYKGHGKKIPEKSKFRSRAADSTYTMTTGTGTGGTRTGTGHRPQRLSDHMTEEELEEEFEKLCVELEKLRSRCPGDSELARRLALARLPPASSRAPRSPPPPRAARPLKLNAVFSAVADRLMCTLTPAEESSSSGRELPVEPVPLPALPPADPPAPDPPDPSDAPEVTRTTDAPDDLEPNGVFKISGEANCTDIRPPDVAANGDFKDNKSECKSSPGGGGSGGGSGSGSGSGVRSGHARTHAIVINLDDKSRFTEEVTV